MRIIVSSTPATGHLYPLLGAARALVRRGHEVVVQTGSAFKVVVRTAGLGFVPLPPSADFDLRDLNASFPERVGLGTVESLAYDMEHIFIAPMAAQHDALTRLVHDFKADAVVADQLFLGAAPIMLGPDRDRPIVVGCGITFLGLPREDGLPHGPGLQFEPDPVAAASKREAEFARLGSVLGPVQEMFERQIRTLGGTPVGGPLDVFAQGADLFWQGGIPELDYPRKAMPAHVRHVGLWPTPPAPGELPTWIPAKDGRPIVLVTQGTVANGDLEELVLPTMRALADRRDLVVIGTSGGRPVSHIVVPENAFLTEYLPFDRLLPHVHAMVTNGGFGAVLQALSHGVPIAVAGATEDKPEIAARLAFSGAGIDLGGARPSEPTIRFAVETLLSPASPQRSAAHELAARFAAHDSADIIVSSLELATLSRRRAA